MMTWWIVMGVVFADVAGNLALRKGMAQIGDVTLCWPRDLAGLLRRALTNWALGVGVLCIAMAFVLFVALLSWTDLSFALPATALASAVNTVGARVLLNERVTVGRWAGTLLICVGAALLSF